MMVASSKIVVKVIIRESESELVSQSKCASSRERAIVI